MYKGELHKFWWDNKELVKNICYPNFKEYINLLNNKHDNLFREAYDKKLKNFTKLAYLGTLLTDENEHWGSLDFYFRYDNNLKIIYRVDDCEISGRGGGLRIEFTYYAYDFKQGRLDCPWKNFLIPAVEKYLSLM